MNVDTEFSNHANTYGTYNIIQDKVIQHLLSKVNTEPKNILDLGCGDGSLCKKIDWDYHSFTGVDFAKGMLELHPKSENIECIYGDFNNQELFNNLYTNNYDFIFSSSALQWAYDLERVFKNIKAFNLPIALAIFTSNTFKTINKTAKINSILKSADMVEALAKKYFDVNIEVLTYKLEFNSTKEMFTYIKKSGVSGSRKILSFKQTKELMKNYPLNYLEFEVSFITSFSKS